MNTIFKKLSCFKKKVKSLRIFESRSLSSSSSSSFTPQKFDVFLSFRGKDTRKNFVSFLYKALVSKGIRTFKDDEELERGRPIPPELRQAIKGSRIAVVVVSVTYPASSWCLEELREILKLEKLGLLTVIPIFYEINPSDVRRQSGVVSKQFKKHEKRQSRERVKSWREALTKLASLSGECSKNWEDLSNRFSKFRFLSLFLKGLRLCFSREDDSKLVDGITEKISTKLFSEKPRNDNILIGIDQHMGELYPLFNLNSNEDVQVIGIWGRGSNGRSALASHVYQNIKHHFEAHCFLEDVRRISLHFRDSHLQDELLSNMQGEGLTTKNCHRCLKTIKARLRNKKVLLVANDVDKLEQFDALAEEFSWFGPGSRIIITTQDRQLLISSVVRSVYEVKLLRCYAVRELFRSNAFKERERDDPVGFDQSTYRAMYISGHVFLTLRYIFTLLCDRVNVTPFFYIWMCHLCMDLCTIHLVNYFILKTVHNKFI
ncbi:Disease resistance protein (TIR-NBS class) [Arabidopsis thaliana]|uniref:Disease resistance protein (TIR-NBS class) n=1 Tax=Arabidopsis thaliana TaxID=3702 RepID=F4IF04_ARATH|nr:Disease resistance protein (TIR-NBS class) [Arabidopsis thaliana]AEE35388.1 Disease resistance protein (TIR-NBS class) [Arabidopsis thaliana]|eukprot:NP_001185387.1 Disease resistance protein (TIR-NBS class) [Arabidopsis thaliana]